jgi:hypothetical protein
VAARALALTGSNAGNSLEPAIDLTGAVPREDARIEGRAVAFLERAGGAAQGPRPLRSPPMWRFPRCLGSREAELCQVTPQSILQHFLFAGRCPRR